MSALSIGESQCLTVFCINPGKGCCKRKKTKPSLACMQWSDHCCTVARCCAVRCPLVVSNSAIAIGKHGNSLDSAPRIAGIGKDLKTS